jgi:catechol 2,3-dioxygenase-like lactoylglutathione lyase family enzyme
MVTVDAGSFLARTDYDGCDMSDHPRDRTAVNASWTIVGVEPIFIVADAQRSKAHYERLGFTTSEYDEHYAFAERGRLNLHLAEADPEATPGAGCIYLHVDDADVLAGEWRSAGLEVVGPDDYDYGKREGSHTDPDGNRIRFGSPLHRHSH